MRKLKVLLITFKAAVSGLGPSDRQDLIGPYVPSHTPCSETVDCHGRLAPGVSASSRSPPCLWYSLPGHISGGVANNRAVLI